MLCVAACTAPANAAAGPLDGDGMWIWYVSRSGGDADSIADTARRYGLETVLIKSSDAGNYWEQFSPGLVAALQARGLDVCAWPFVYGSVPREEAQVSERAIEAGANCLVIDAETHYEGRYGAADTYVQALRNRVGDGFPLALASFPYVDYHPAFPYSVFLGEGGAELNAPQVYWRAIGDSVKGALSHTYRWNLPYGRPIFPIGQTYQDPPRSQLVDFRRQAMARGAGGVSWWSWQETSAGEWRALERDVKPAKEPRRQYPRLARGSAGDIVILAQELLLAAGFDVRVDGTYGAGTAAAVTELQEAEGIGADGVIGRGTWRVLLQNEPERIAWSRPRAAMREAGVRAPHSATLPARRSELGNLKGVRPSLGF